MAKGQRIAAAEFRLTFCGGQVFQVRIGNGVLRPDQALRIELRIARADEQHRVVEAGHQHAIARQHAAAFGPHRAHVGYVQVGDRMEHHVEAVVGEYVQVAHVALHRAQLQAIARRHAAVLFQLPVGEIEHGDVGARSGQHRCLLAPARGQAQDAAATHIAQPVQWQRAWGQMHLPAAFARGGNG